MVVRHPANIARQRGFTMIEALLAVAIIVVVASLGLPALERMLVRSKLQGSAREISIHLNSARITAMRLGRNVVVLPEYGTQALVSFVDEDENEALDAGEQEIARLAIPGSGGTRGIYLMGPDGVEGTAAAPAQSVDGLTQVGASNVRAVVFQPDGSVADPGGLRISDAKSPGNVFEVRIDPAATARVEILKFTHGDVDGLDPLGSPPGSWYPQGGNAWDWY